jgi:endoglucanase
MMLALLARAGVANAAPPLQSITPTPPRPLTPSAAIRLNQVGYLPEEPKVAVVQSREALAGRRFAVVAALGGKRVFYHGVLGKERGEYGAFPHHYPADFTPLSRPGTYRLRLEGGPASPLFRIGEAVYRPLPGLILQFFRVQRCGDTEPLGHASCHRTDARAGPGPDAGASLDLSGGWHDAGDYLKFATTISYATLLLLESAERYPGAFPPASRSRSTLLGEARLGVEWLLKLRPTPDGFYYQVGAEGEHEYWGRPEEADSSPSPNPRLALYGAGANVAGRAAAALALAARLYHVPDPALARRSAATSVTFYECGLRHPVVLSTQPPDFYPERSWEQDMSLAATQLFRLTGRAEYRRDALHFAAIAGPGDGAVSLYGVHGLAHATLLPLAPSPERKQALGYLLADCERARAQAHDPFQLAVTPTWGTAGRACGAGSLCLIAAPLLRDPTLLDLARAQRDYLLGCNPFGVSFLIGAGGRYPRHPHHPLAQLASLPLVGAVVGGPAPLDLWKKQPMADGMGKHASPDDPALQSPAAVYHDDVGDWVTNEPALDYAADALFLLAAYAR